MRVPFTSGPAALVYQLNQLTTRQQRLQNQAASGQKLTVPADDPAAMQRVLRLQTEAAQAVQYKNNLALLGEKADAAYDVMRAVKTVSDRAGEIAILADGTRSPQSLEIYANEVAGLIRQAVDTLNTQFQGDYLFSGTQTDRAPFAVVTDANGEITGVTYAGNTRVTEVPISDRETLAVQVPGANTSGSGPRGLVVDAQAGADLFGHLVSLYQHLKAGDTGAIAATDRAALSRDEENLLLHLGTAGVTQSRIETASKLVASRRTAIEEMISGEADADLAETLVQLNAAQNAYRAALQSGASLFDVSLLDFLG